LLSRAARKRKTVPDNGPARRLYGLYPATCRDNNDPEKIGRIRMECALVWGVGMKNLSPWAWPKNMPMAGGHCHRNADGTVEVQGDMGAFIVPEEGSPVWVEFVAGDPSYPVYSTGYWGGSAEGRTNDTTVHPSMVPLESKRLCPEQYPCFGDAPRTCLDCEDALEHGVTDSYDDIEHRPFHDHREGKFYCPRLRHLVPKSETGHSIIGNDKDGREFLAIIDRTGQCLKFKGRILPELQIGTWADGTMRGNMLPRGERIMDRNTEGLEVEPEAPAEFPTAAAATALSAADLTQTAIADALDGLLTPAARAALQGTPLGNVLGMMDSATLGGVALTPSAVFEAFVGGATAAAQNAVTTAMAAVGTSPGALLAAITSTVGVVDALTGTAQTALAAVQSLLPGVFPTVLAPAVIASAFEGYDPRLYCVDQHASAELRDLARGFYRLETAAVLDEVEVEGASAAPAVASAAALASLGLTQVELVTLMDALSLPAVATALSGTSLGTMLTTISGLNLNGIPLTPAAILDAFTGGATAVVRNTVTALLATVNLTPLSFVNALSTFTVTAPVLSALRLIPGAGALTGIVAGVTGITALSSVLNAIPGAAALGGVLGMFGLLGFTSLFGFFPSLGIVIGEKAIIWRSDRDLTRHQSIVIDHATGQEKVILSGLNLEGEQVGPQMIIDSTLGSRVTIVDPVSGSFENLECSTGGTKEALYEGGRIVGTGFDDALFVGGDWLCMVGFPSPLAPRAPIDVLPLLDEKAYIEPQAVGGSVLPGLGNTLHASLLTSTRWAGLSIFDVAALNYTRLVGGIDTLHVGGAHLVTIGGAETNWIGGVQTNTIGGAQANLIGGARNSTIGGGDFIQVGGAHALVAGLFINRSCAGAIWDMAGLTWTGESIVKSDVRSLGMVTLTTHDVEDYAPIAVIIGGLPVASLDCFASAA
jgi:hypothetical protein